MLVLVLVMMMVIIVGGVMLVYSVYDLKAEVYGSPIVTRSEAEAIRIFTMLVSDHGTTVGRFPGEFSLRRLGEFNEVDGSLSSSVSTVINGESCLSLMAPARSKKESL